MAAVVVANANSYIFRERGSQHAACIPSYIDYASTGRLSSLAQALKPPSMLTTTE